MGVGSLFIVVTQGTRGVLTARYNDSLSTYTFIISESKSGNMGEQRLAIKCSHPEGTHHFPYLSEFGVEGKETDEYDQREKKTEYLKVDHISWQEGADNPSSTGPEALKQKAYKVS